MSETILTETNQKSRLDEDTQLVHAAQRNPEAFKFLYQKWLPRIYRYIYFRVGNSKDAEDLTSQVFLKIFEHLPRYREQGRFSAWLFSVAHARVVDFYRRGHKAEVLNETTADQYQPDLLALSARNEEIRQVLSLLGTLKEEEQELIRLRFAAELSYPEIGVILNRKEDAVRKSLSRLLYRLQLQLEDQHE